jgi:hypothetical protein
MKKAASGGDRGGRYLLQEEPLIFLPIILFKVREEPR